MQNHIDRLNKKIKESRQFFNKRRPGNIRPDNINSLSPVQKYVFMEISNLIPVGTRDSIAVDLGCHWGRYSSFMANAYGQVVGIDFAEQALATAVPGKNITYVQLDLNTQVGELIRYAPVDLFLAIALFEMIKDPELLCKYLYKAGNSGCKVLIVIPNRYSLNYRSLRIVLWVFRSVLKKHTYIYNNGITINAIINYLKEAGFQIESQGAIVGAPVYLLDRFPYFLQRFLLKLDALYKLFFGGSYHWVLVKK